MNVRRPSPQFPEFRLAGLTATVLVHALIIFAWQQARKVAPPHWPEADYVQWVRVPPQSAIPLVDKRNRDQDQIPLPTAPLAPSPLREAGCEAVSNGVVAGASEAGVTDGVPGNGAIALMEQARRDAGAIDKALRKESKPVIVAPPDSPQIRMAN